MTNAGCTFELVMLSYKALWHVEAIQSLLEIAPWYVGAWHRGLGTTLSHSIVMKSCLIRVTLGNTMLYLLDLQVSLVLALTCLLVNLYAVNDVLYCVTYVGWHECQS